MAAAGFEPNPKQVILQKLMGGPARHIMARGGGRSGKTFWLMRGVCVRALKAERSTHAVLRFRFNHLKASIIFDTAPKVMRTCFPEIPFHINQSDWFCEFPNESRIYFGGLDDKQRTEKILGQEHSTIYFNECSQISYDARNQAVTRLAQKSGLTLRAYYDCNPPTVGHWTYRLFEKGLEPRSGMPLTNPENYVTMQMNPIDNLENIAKEYVEELRALPEADQRRFLHGEYTVAVDGALWMMDTIDSNRVRRPVDEAGRNELISRMRRVCVAVDPSGCQGPEDQRSDEVGIVVVGTDAAGHGYVLEDLSGRYGPEAWGERACLAYHRWAADAIVAEGNFGGPLVDTNIKASDPRVKVVMVRASRGKTQRAEPVASLYEQRRVSHVGAFPDLEEQMTYFSRAGYQGPKSPDRADAAVWGLTHLMLADGASTAFGGLRA